MLIGTKVLDLTRVLAGPLCAMALGDLGADVLKVERIGEGDDTRAWGPPFDDRGESAYYLSVNRNKLSVAVDLDDPQDLGLVADLATGADVVIENFRPGTLERRGLDPAALLLRCPHLIWCTISGFGGSSRRPGYDFVTQAECGWMAITGEPNGDPMKAGVPLADIVTGKDAAIAILAALLSRARTGQGRRIEISLAKSASAALVNVAQNALVSGAEAPRWGNAHPNLVPYQLFRAADRPLVIAVGNDGQWKACTRALGLHHLTDDPALATNAGRVADRERIIREFSTRIATRSAAAWQSVLDDAGVPSGVVKSILDMLADCPGASPIAGMPSSVGGEVRLPPPRLDEHGALVRARGWGAFSA